LTPALPPSLRCSDAAMIIPGTSSSCHEGEYDHSDDYYHAYDDYDDYDEDGYNERGDTMAAGLHRTRGRRPSTRSKKVTRR
jgi:hypothetical protein